MEEEKMEEIYRCPKCKKSFESDNNTTCVVLISEEISCVYCGFIWEINP